MGNKADRPECFDLIGRGKEIEDAFRHAVKSALLIHKKLGNSVAAWRDGKVAMIPPEEIPVDENDPDVDYEVALRDFAFVHGTRFLRNLKEDEI